MRISRTLLTALLTAGTTFGAPNIPLDARKRQASNVRTDAVKEAFMHSWNGYTKYAFGFDELSPVSNKGTNSRNGWGASMVDAMSTAILMGLDDVVLRQLEHIKTVDFTKTAATVSLFETTIRYLGGLLSGYDLLKGPYKDLLPSNSTELVDALVDQAIILADALAFGFDTDSGVPANNLNFTSKSFTDTTNGIATAGTLVLEWTRLADITGNQKYAELSQKAESYLLKPTPSLGEPFPGLLGTDLDTKTGNFINSRGGWGGGTDSFYEYLIKMWVYDEKKFELYKERWIAAADSTIKYLTSHPQSRQDITFVAEYQNAQTLSLNQGHLTCFIGGNFILGGQVLSKQEYTDYGLALTSGCHQTYNSTASSIGPEGWSWDPNNVPTAQSDFFARNGFYITASYYDLRPEVIESYYHAYIATGDKKYREWAWDAFLAINATARTASGFTAVSDVNRKDGGSKYDNQESFWFAEVLKYLYLIFDEGGKVGFVKGTEQEWVFNTEAHPFKVRN
ncbi:glycoside hydrolase [Choiromyces venosus 120613-1]|uniref:alpha-1,2-Mannosidase n=1 Tax=Choiromyces venosus 120613-1 TaxID=1336337 RepID=A0A3N4JY26_9PEZI|nr:glycoside hydrolase [Choiromyces venosus 120613-1]